MKVTTQYDVIIIGAGPAGATCALQLRHSGLRVLLLDKATFPRTKICGDAVVGRSIKTLYTCCPELIADFRQFSAKTRITHTRLHINGKKPFDIHWVNEAYCCRRIDFDNCLINAVRKYASNVTILENFVVDCIENGINSEKNSAYQGIKVGNEAKQQFFQAKIIVGCDGAQSIVNKKMTDTKLSHAHHVGAVRTYFKGLKGLNINRTEVFVLPNFSPGYFWVFPLSEDTANIGFGMLTEKISEKKINLRKALLDFIEQSLILRGCFEGSEQIGKIEGFGLPLGSRRVTMSGNHFLLAGDAASLIDPASGDGISNAIISGKVAGETILEAFKINDFTASFLEKYDSAVYKNLGKELMHSTIILRLFVRMPFLLNIVAALMNIPFFKRLGKKWM